MKGVGLRLSYSCVLHKCVLLPPANEFCEGYVFTPVCHSVHRGCLPQCMLGYTPLEQTSHGSRHPLEQTPSRADTPQTPPPRADTHHPPRSKHPPGADTTPPCSACWEIRATSGRYASYWNAFLSFIFVCNIRPYGQNTF